MNRRTFLGVVAACLIAGPKAIAGLVRRGSHPGLVKDDPRWNDPIYGVNHEELKRQMSAAISAAEFHPPIDLPRYRFFTKIMRENRSKGRK